MDARLNTLSRVPVELKQRKQWVLWKSVMRGGKLTKMPLMPDGEPASSTDPSTWCDFKTCIELQSGFSGCGFVFAQDGAYIGIDLDGCRDPESGKIELWAREVIERFKTYTELSPSGSGVKLFGVAKSRWMHRNNVKLPLPAVGGKDPGVEVYDSKRFFCITGKQLRGYAELASVDEPLEWLASKFEMLHPLPTISGEGIKQESPVLERASKYLAKMEPSISGQAGHNKCFHAACVLVMGFALTDDEALHLLTSEFNPRCAPPWSERELRHKVAQAGRQPGSRGYLRDAQPEQWSRITIPSSYREQKQPEPEKEKPQLQHMTLRQAAAMYLADLSSGREMLIDTGIPDLDHAIGGGMALGEMVIIAARPSHGKSAIGLQMIHSLTSQGMPVVLLSEEMSALALGKRAIQFISKVPEEHWSNSFEEIADELNEHFKNRAPVRIIEQCGTIDRACQEIERAKQEMDCKVAVIDYVQLLGTSGKDRYDKISRVSTALRNIAGRLQIVVVVMAQLNREIENRPKFVPKMSDIKETGQLEQDADVIIFGVWPHRINSENDPSKYQIFVCKNRNRAINEMAFELTFKPSRQMLLDPRLENKYAKDFASYANSWNG